MNYFVLENPHRQSELDYDGSFHSNLWSAMDTIERSDAEVTLLYEGDSWGKVIPTLPDEWSSYDVLHCGLNLGGDNVFNNLWYLSVNWLFLNPRSDKISTSWKATPQWCMIRPGQVRAIGGFDRAYQSAEAALMDFAYRLLLAGGRVCHIPTAGYAQAEVKINLVDELLFIIRRIKKRAAVYASFWMVINSLRF